jgi:hypothetical protein
VIQDNTGLVTITPNGEGAVSYEIYYETLLFYPVQPGQNTNFVYKEGT